MCETFEMLRKIGEKEGIEKGRLEEREKSCRMNI